LKVKRIIILASLICCLALTFSRSKAQLTDDDAKALEEIQMHRKEKDAEFRDPDKTPLPKKQIRKFKGLHYFEPDLHYRVKAKFIKNEKPVLFKMKTTTDRLPDYQKYGDVVFMLNGVEYKLEVYQSPDISKKPEYKDYLFIPFTDETNGKEPYEVGRYIDLRIPSTDEVIVDFNKCYSPYCSYGSGYSCVKPPDVNHLPIEVKAGEKKFHE
jgi:uncharacterized protein (DUF1684 family)